MFIENVLKMFHKITPVPPPGGGNLSQIPYFLIIYALSPAFTMKCLHAVAYFKPSSFYQTLSVIFLIISKYDLVADLNFFFFSQT